MSLALDFPSPFFSGTAISPSDLVPGKYDVGLQGRGYLLDLDSKEFQHATIPRLKPQQDTSGQLGERSINPQGLWRFSRDTFHRGAGQIYADREESDPSRFRSSKGMNVWDRWQLSLLPDTTRKRTSANTNLALLTAGDHLYIADGNTLAFYTIASFATPSSFNSNIHAAEAAQNIAAITSDGYYVYAAVGVNGVHRTQRGATTSAHYSDLQCTLLAYLKGRLMAARDHELFNITASGAAPAALYTHPNADFRWVGFAAGPAFIYIAGYSGDKSLIYKTAVKEDGVGLDIPIVAGELPDGETVRSIGGYLTFIVLGTSKGVRFATLDGNGNLSIGALIPTTSAVRAFEGQESFIWYGWSNYDNLSTGLGRLDLRQFVADNAPAHASDLMATGQGEVLSITTFDNKRVFAVSALGMYAEDTNKVTTGTIDSGLITFGLADTKIGIYLDVRYSVIQGTNSPAVAKTDRSFTQIGTHSPTFLDELPCGQPKAEALEIRHTFARSATDNTLGPILSRYTLKADILTDVSEHIIIPLLLTENEHLRNDSTNSRDVAEELAFLKALRRNRDVVLYQEGTTLYSCLIEDLHFFPHHLDRNSTAFNGTCILKLKVI